MPYVGDEPRALQSAPELTHETVHEFLSYEDLQSFFKGFSRRHGFEVRWDAGGRPDGAAHSGAARCWCSGVPSATNSLGSINIAAQRIRHEKLTVRGRVKSGCLWRVCFNRTGEKGEWMWHVTKQRQLQHNHDLLPVDQPRPIASLSNVPDSAKDLLSGLLRSGVQGEAVLRRVAQAQLQMHFEESVFHNLLNSIRRSLGVCSSGEGEFKQLLLWLAQQMEEQKGVARFSTTSERQLDIVFYMSRDMLYNLDRNGCVLIMDATHKTNRFGWPLLLVCGINEHGQTVLFSVALLQSQTTAAFTWVLEQMQSVLTPEAWANIGCVATDGDQAMDAAIQAVLPAAHRSRCWYHIEQNLRHNLLADLTVRMDEFITAWKAACHCQTETEHLDARRALHSEYPAAVPYLEANTWKNAERFAVCYTKHWCTLGILSTQRVEGMNAKLKGALHINCKTPLRVLFETLEFAASDIDRAAVAKMQEKDALYVKEAYRETIGAMTHPFISGFAQLLLEQQFAVTHNYRVWSTTVDGSTTFTVQRATRTDQPRTVTATADSMSCSCFFPITHQLPCRHVLCLNQHLMLRPFVPAQVGKRWLRSFKPPRAYKPGLPLSSVISGPGGDAAASQSLPSFLTTTVRAAASLTQQQRYGQLMGLLRTVAERGADDEMAYPAVHERVQQLLSWVLEETSEARPATAQAQSAPLSSSITSLNPSTTIDEVVEPLVPKRKRGKAQEKRHPSQGERAPAKRKRAGAVSMSLTQQ